MQTCILKLVYVYIMTYFLMYLSFVFYLPEDGHMIGRKM